jgi:glyoxylase-like metal-dependent hydrolase (beta-lactamase superfamily II)
MADTDAVTLVEIAPEVYLMRYPVLDVNATLIVGGEVAVVVDTLSTNDQARGLLAGVRALTALPLVIVNTHHHFDHCFGNSVLAAESPGCAIWAHEAAAAALRDEGVRLQREWYVEWLTTHPELAEGLAAARVVPPNRTVHTESTMDIGGRVLELRHFGRGHTDGDLVVAVPDAGVLLTGDLVEQGGPPSFVDGYPLHWPETVAALLHLITPRTTVVPGHGSVVDVDHVRAQHDELTQLAWQIRDGHYDRAVPEAVAARAPFGLAAALIAVKRGYAELDGRT